jgi:hypothetical protein
MSWRVSTARGTFIDSMQSRNALIATITVEIPVSSRSRATCPTDTWQTGHNGTSSAASILSSRSISAHSGPTLLSNLLCDVAPTNE